MCVLNASLGPNSKMLRSSLKQCIDLAKSDITKLLNHKELAPGYALCDFYIDCVYLHQNLHYSFMYHFEIRLHFSEPNKIMF